MKALAFTVVVIVLIALTPNSPISVLARDVMADARPAPLAAPVGTAFTYQGQLMDGGQPADGVYDFEFTLYDDEMSGSPVGSPVAVEDALVTGGLFTVELDFGASAFAGEARWLEIGVRAGDSVGAYTTLDPRQAITPTPYALHAAQVPWSGMSSVPAGFADGVDNGSAYQNVIIVAKGGGDFTTITAALNSISDASDGNRYLVWVAPGVYSERVTMKQYVDIEGAGELTTKITFTGDVTYNTGTVVGANDAELRFLTVENTGGNAYAIAILVIGIAPRLTHVTASASGGTNSNYGVSVDTSISATMSNVTASASGGANSYGVFNLYSSTTMMSITASASGGTNNYGVYNFDSSSVAMTNVTATASGGTNNYGVINNGSSPTMTNIAASASGGTNSHGVYNWYSSSPTINNSVLRASGGSNNYGLYNSASGGAYTVLVNNSQITGSTNAIRNDAEFTTRIGASQLFGGAVTGGGTVTCAGVYDENYAFSASTCP